MGLFSQYFHGTNKEVSYCTWSEKPIYL